LPNANGLHHILRTEHPELVEVCDKHSLCWLAGALRRGWIPGVPRPTLVGIGCMRMDDSVKAYVAAAPALRRLADFYLRKAYVPLFVSTSPFRTTLRVNSPALARGRGPAQGVADGRAPCGSRATRSRSRVGRPPAPGKAAEIP
jgi:hypothetical protein